VFFDLDIVHVKSNTYSATRLARQIRIKGEGDGHNYKLRGETKTSKYISYVTGLF
jgi:hypothetical protein